MVWQHAAVTDVAPQERVVLSLCCGWAKADCRKCHGTDAKFRGKVRFYTARYPTFERSEMRPSPRELKRVHRAMIYYRVL